MLRHWPEHALTFKTGASTLTAPASTFEKCASTLTARASTFKTRALTTTPRSLLSQRFLMSRQRLSFAKQRLDKINHRDTEGTEMRPSATSAPPWWKRLPRPTSSFSKGGARIVAVAPPRRVVEMDDAVAVVRRDRRVERDRSDRSPVAELAGLLQRVQLVAVRHARVRCLDAERQLAFLRG